MTPLSSLRRTALVALLALLAATAAAAEPAPGPGSGDVPPPALGRNLEGEDVLLTNYAGKAVVLTFWATWCPYCIKELPILQRVQDRAGKDRIQVIAVNIEDHDVFLRASHVMRPAITLELVNDASGKAQKAYGVHGIPYMVIVGRDGRIVNVWRGYSEDSLNAIVKDINRALAPTP